MNIILEVEGGNELCISVGPFDTVRHVKETVQTLHHIPISLQNFFFNGQLVQDDLHIFTSQLFHGARIQLLLAPHQPPTITPSPPPTLPDYDNDPVTLKVKVPKSKDRIPIEAELNDTVLKVKEKIGALEEMRGKVKVKVAPMRTKEKIEIEVNVLDRVAVLREELNKLQRRLGFPLPQQGCYFFIHRQQVMYEENSFQWHDVRQGDTIETFDGYISDNSSSSSSKPSSRPPR
uniref:Ubiquitin-like domain-containing protein n=1 Tax=Cajanus cajan TaxID=3821 RepID=A0A151U713_CAJCA|nr:hypothetical protein KK1_007778 [Cajanus cajan]